MCSRLRRCEATVAHLALNRTPRSPRDGGRPDLAVRLHGALQAAHSLTQTPTSTCAQYGSPKFLEQHDWIVQLNVQAHQNAVAHSDEFVMEALVSRGKVDALIHNLLVAEAWRENALPLLRDHLARAVDSVISWSLLYHETALSNLLEVRCVGVLQATVFCMHAACSTLLLQSATTNADQTPACATGGAVPPLCMRVSR